MVARRQRIRHRRFPCVWSGGCHRAGFPALLAAAPSTKLMSGDRRTPKSCGAAPRVTPASHVGPRRLAPEAGWHFRRTMPCGARMSFFSFELDPALAADPVFELHVRGKMPSRRRCRCRAGTTCRSRTPPGWRGYVRRLPLIPLARDYTWTGHTVAVVTDGSAVLGLGNIGPGPPCPSWRARPCCSSSSAAWTRYRSAWTRRTPTRSCGSSPRWRQTLAGSTSRTSRAALLRDRAPAGRGAGIPVFHDDQHGTAIVVLAALRNAAALLDRSWASCAS